MATKRTQEIDLGLTRREYADDPKSTRRAVLEIETSKAYNGGVESDATVYWHGDHSRQHSFGLAGGGDFSKRLKRDTTVKATQKAIDTQYAQVFTADVLAALMAEAKEYYAGAAGVVVEEAYPGGRIGGVPLFNSANREYVTKANDLEDK